MNSSRIEERLKQILGETTQVRRPNSRVEEILKCIFDGSSYEEPAKSRIERGFIKILEDSTDPIKNPGSRIEYLLNRIIRDEELSSVISRSRIEDLLKKWNVTPEPIPGIQKYISFSESPFTLQNTVGGEIQLQSFYGKTFHNVEPTFQQPQNFYNAGEEDDFVYVFDGANISGISLEGGLSGIPNTMSNPTYMDDNGILYLSDFIDIGTGRLIKQTKVVSIDNTLNWYSQPNITEYRAVFFNANYINTIAPYNQQTTWESTVSNIGCGNAKASIDSGSILDYVESLDGPLIRRGPANGGSLQIAFAWKFGIRNNDDLFSYLEGKDAKVLLPIDQVGRDLTSEELKTLIPLYTKNESTTIEHNLGKVAMTYMSKS